MRFARMVVNGLYFHHFSKRVPDTHVVAGAIFPDLINHSVDGGKWLNEMFSQFENDDHHEVGAGVFEYKFHVHPYDPDGTEWLMTLYGAFVFGGSIVRRDSEIGRLASEEDQRSSVHQFRRSRRRQERVVGEVSVPISPPTLESLERVEGKEFSDCALELDGRFFVNCRFTRCKITYAGGVVPMFDGGTFDSCSFEFTEAAERTIHMLGRLYKKGASGIVEGIFDSVRGRSP